MRTEGRTDGRKGRRADGQTDSMTKLIVPFRNFVIAPKNSLEAACIVFFADVLFALIYVQTVPLYCFNVCFKFSSFLQSSDRTCGWSRHCPLFPAIFFLGIVAKSRKLLRTDYVGLKIISSQPYLFGYDWKLLRNSFCCGIQERVSGSQWNTQYKFICIRQCYQLHRVLPEEGTVRIYRNMSEKLI